MSLVLSVICHRKGMTFVMKGHLAAPLKQSALDTRKFLEGYSEIDHHKQKRDKW